MDTRLDIDGKWNVQPGYEWTPEDLMKWENEDGPPTGVQPPNGVVPPIHVQNGPVVLPTLHLKFIPEFSLVEFYLLTIGLYFIIIAQGLIIGILIKQYYSSKKLKAKNVEEQEFPEKSHYSFFKNEYSREHCNPSPTFLETKHNLSKTVTKECQENIAKKDIGTNTNETVNMVRSLPFEVVDTREPVSLQVNDLSWLNNLITRKSYTAPTNANYLDTEIKSSTEKEQQ